MKYLFSLLLLMAISISLNAQEASFYQKYAEKGYTSTKTHTYLDSDGQHMKVHTYWTPKGRLFIYDLLKNDNIYPNIERDA